MEGMKGCVKLRIKSESNSQKKKEEEKKVISDGGDGGLCQV